MPITLAIHPLTQADFASSFGQVIEADPARMKLINGGNTERFHALAEAEVAGEGARVILNIFRGQPRPFPYELTMMERHPFGSQSFSPLNGSPISSSSQRMRVADPVCLRCFWPRSIRA